MTRSALAHPRMLWSGPGKLTVALAIDGTDHGRDLCGGRRKARSSQPWAGR